MLALIVAVAIVSLTVGGVASRFIISPGDAAVRTREPDPSNIAVPVERRELVSKVVTRGEIALGDAFSLSIPATEGSVVTEHPPTAGAKLAEGDLLVEVSERPVLLLSGPVPMYRDMLPGSTGADVEQLEQSLKRLGFDPGVVDAKFDGATEKALADLYQARGYAAPEPSADDVGRLEEARQRVVAAQAAVADAGGAAGTEAEVGVRDAERALASARRAALGVALEGDGAVETANAVATAASEAESSASADLEAARQRGAPPDELRELAAAARSASVDRVSAANGVSLAEAQRTQANADAQAAIESASDQITLAKRQLADVAGSSSASSRAPAELDVALEELATVDAEVGIPALRSELIFVPSLPATISAVTVTLGSPIEGTIAEASQASVEARTAIPERARDLLASGASVEVSASDATFEASGTLVAIATKPDDSGAFPARIAIDGEDLDPLAIQGASVKITIPVGRTEGPVLVVPVSALFSSVDGSARVEVSTTNDHTERVAVRPGLSADGYVEVEAIDSDLEEGDLVVVGREN